MAVNTMYFGNADPERGFSINKYLLPVHGSQIKEGTIELVEDQNIQRNGIMNVPITKDLLKSCQSASQKYNVYLEAKKDEEELRKKRELEAATKKQASNENENLKVELEQCKRDLEILELGVKIAEDTLAEGNKDLHLCLQKKSMDRSKLQMCQAKDMGLKRQQTLSSVVSSAEKKILKLEKKQRNELFYCKPS